ncbi:putative SPX domain-containing protein, partial [Seiridium unicorne]
MAETVERKHAFKEDTATQLSEHLTQVEMAYATMNTAGNLEQARRELRLDLREHVVWERNTVWRDMIGIE